MIWRRFFKRRCSGEGDFRASVWTRYSDGARDVADESAARED